MRLLLKLLRGLLRLWNKLRCRWSILPLARPITSPYIANSTTIQTATARQYRSGSPTLRLKEQVGRGFRGISDGFNLPPIII